MFTSLMFLFTSAIAGSAPGVISQQTSVTDSAQHGKTIGALEPGARVTILNSRNGWAKVELDRDGATTKGFVPTSTVTSTFLQVDLDDDGNEEMIVAGLRGSEVVLQALGGYGPLPINLGEFDDGLGKARKLSLRTQTLGSDQTFVALTIAGNDKDVGTWTIYSHLTEEGLQPVLQERQLWNGPSARLTRVGPEGVVLSSETETGPLESKLSWTGTSFVNGQ